MRSAITISLPEEVGSELDKASKSEGVSRSDIVSESLRDYLFLKKFRALRKKMMIKANKQGVYTDQDVFARIS